MKESISKKYHPNDEEIILRELDAFGWKITMRNEVFHQQEVFDSAYTLGYGNYSTTMINTSTSTTNYISAVFERRSEEIENYDEINSLWKQYDSMERQMDLLWAKRRRVQLTATNRDDGTGMGMIIPGFLFSTLGIGLLLGSQAFSVLIGWGIASLVLGLPLIIIGFIRRKSVKSQRLQYAESIIRSEIMPIRNKQIEIYKKAAAAIVLKEKE